MGMWSDGVPEGVQRVLLYYIILLEEGQRDIGLGWAGMGWDGMG